MKPIKINDFIPVMISNNEISYEFFIEENGLSLLAKFKGEFGIGSRGN